MIFNYCPYGKLKKMKLKIAKREASDYESSLSSHQSCYDSLVTQFTKSNYMGSSCGSKGIMISHDCQTPSKNVINNYDKSYSLKKLGTCRESQWAEDEQNDEKKENNWLTESEDSKIRKKQGYYGQLQKINYKQHARALRFQQERIKQKLDKENEPMAVNTNILSSEDENNDFFQIKQQRKKNNKRKVGKILYQSQKQRSSLQRIKQQ